MTIPPYALHYPATDADEVSRFKGMSNSRNDHHRRAFSARAIIPNQFPPFEPRPTATD
jgi:hypothetical protein